MKKEECIYKKIYNWLYINFKTNRGGKREMCRKIINWMIIGVLIGGGSYLCNEISKRKKYSNIPKCNDR